MNQNITPTDDQLRFALQRFTKFPAERSSDPIECHLYNRGFIARAKSNRRAANRKHGRYARQIWTITEKGRAFLNPCMALVPLSHYVTLRVGVNKALYHSAAHPFEIFPTQQGALWFAEWIGA